MREGRLSSLQPVLARLGPHLRWLLLGTVAGGAAVLASIGLLSLSGWFLSATAVAGLSISTAQAFNFFHPSVGVRLFAGLRILSRYGERVLNHEATFRILESLRTWFYLRLEPLSPGGLNRFRSGDVLHRLVADIDVLDLLYVRILSPAGAAALTVGALGVFLLCFDTALAAVAVGLLLAACVLLPLAMAWAGMSVGSGLSLARARLRTVAVEAIQGIAELLVYQGRKRHLEQLNELDNRMLSHQRRMNRLAGFSEAALTLVSGFAVMAALGIGVRLVHARQLSGESLACVVLAVWAAFEAAAPLSGAFQHIGNLLESARRVNEVAGAEPAVRFPPSGAPVPDRHNVVFEGVRFRYEPDLPPALDGVDLHLEHGSRSAVVGETGSGKSTLAQLLVRFWDPDEGIVSVGGTDIRKLGENKLRRLWSVVPQQPHLFHASLRENLYIGDGDASEERLYDALDQIHLADFVRSLPDGLETIVGEGGKKISGGQARRIAVARAILHDAPIWLLDEPTEGLDTVTERRLVDELLRITEGRTLIWITHRLVRMDRMDTIFVLDGGKVVESGSHRSLLSAGNRYAALHLRLP